MNLITLQSEIEKDSIGWLVSENLKRSIKITGIILPAETNLSAGWSEFRFKILRGNEISNEIMLKQENQSRQYLGAEKIYLEIQQIVIMPNRFVNGSNYQLVFECKNGTGSDRMYTIQVWYE